VNPQVSEIVKRGTKLIEDSKYEDALACFEEALLIDPNDPDIWNKKGISLRSLGRYEEAIECFNKSLEISPRDLDAS
jgi:tetratricopeptide (TPR) repeat protein